MLIDEKGQTRKMVFHRRRNQQKHSLPTGEGINQNGCTPLAPVAHKSPLTSSSCGHIPRQHPMSTTLADQDKRRTKETFTRFFFFPKFPLPIIIIIHTPVFLQRVLFIANHLLWVPKPLLGQRHHKIHHKKKVFI